MPFQPPLSRLVRRTNTDAGPASCGILAASAVGTRVCGCFPPVSVEEGLPPPHAPPPRAGRVLGAPGTPTLDSGAPGEASVCPATQGWTADALGAAPLLPGLGGYGKGCMELRPAGSQAPEGLQWGELVGPQPTGRRRELGCRGAGHAANSLLKKAWRQEPPLRGLCALQGDLTGRGLVRTEAPTPLSHTHTLACLCAHVATCTHAGHTHPGAHGHTHRCRCAHMHMHTHVHTGSRQQGSGTRCWRQKAVSYTGLEIPARYGTRKAPKPWPLPMTARVGASTGQGELGALLASPGVGFPSTPGST